MLSDKLKSIINRLWDKFWSRGFSNPMTAIEQISYLLFMRRLDDIDALEKAKSTFDEQDYKSIFEGNEDCRWSNFSKLEPEQMLKVVSEKAFPFIKTINDDTQPYTKYMKDAVFSINKANLMYEAVQEINEIFDEIKEQQSSGQQFQDTQGDVYEYLLNELSSSGKNGQFRTPRHLIQFMCELLDPDWTDTICDPACGTGGFLLGAYQHILSKHSSSTELIEDENGFKRFKKYGGDAIKDKKIWDKLHRNTFFGFDMDQTMVRIGLMNLMLHGIKIPQILDTDTLSKEFDKKHSGITYSLIMANPPFTGNIDEDDKSKNLVLKGKQTELLFLIRITRMLKKGGKAAVIIPEGVLFGGNNDQKTTREVLLKDNKLEAVISLPSGAFIPYTGVKTSILVFTKVKDNSKKWNTNKVWFYELASDGYSLDKNRRKLAENPIPVAVNAYKQKDKTVANDRKNHFFVPIDEIQINDLDLSYNRYREFEYEEQEYRKPQEILNYLFELEDEIRIDMEELKNLIGK